MLEQLPRDRRHAAGGIHLFALDYLHRADGLELAHVDNGVPRRHRAHQARGQRGCVEQRDHRQRDLSARLGERIAAADDRARHGIAGRQDVGHEIAMRAERALRLAGGAAGVEDRGLVLRVQRGIGQRARGQARPILRDADHLFQPLCTVQRGGDAADEYAAQTRQLRAERGDPLPPLVIGDQHGGARILQAIGQFLARPPGVERHGDGAGHGDGEEGDDPFGQVAHRQRDAVALLHPARGEIGRQRRDRAELRIIADPLVLIDRRQPLAMRLRQRDERGHVRRRVLPHARRHAADRHRLHLELRARRGQHRFGFLHRHGGPGCGLGLRRHVRFSHA